MSEDKDKSLSELEANIAQTRQNLGDDVEALSYKLSPERFRNSFKAQTEQTLAGAQEVVMDSVQEVTDNVAQRAQEAGSSFFDMVRRHPLPTVLIGAGVVLLAAGGGVGIRRANEDDDGYVGYGTRYGYGEGDYTGYVRPGFGDEASAATGYTEPDYQVRGRYAQGYGDPQGVQGYGTYDSGSSAGGGTSGYAGSDAYSSGSQDDGSDVRDRARQARAKTKNAGNGLADFIESQPLVAGFITAILGALIGLLLPGTRQEDQLMGDARDQLAEQAKEAAERARQVAQKTFDEAKETAKAEFSHVTEDAKAGLNQVANDVKAEGENLIKEGKEAAKKVADDAKETAKNESNKQKNN